DAVALGLERAHRFREVRERRARSAAHVDHVRAARAVVRRAVEDLLDRQPCGVVDLREDLDVVRAVVATQGGEAEVLWDLAEIPGPLLRGDAEAGLQDLLVTLDAPREQDQVHIRKSTRLNSSHVKISYAVFCLKKKKTHCI